MAETTPVIGADAGQVTIGNQIVLPLSKAVEISAKSIRTRFARSLITMSGIILAIAFLMSIWTNSAIVGELRNVNDPQINLLLQKKGIQTTEDEEAYLEEKSKNAWLIVLSLLVCLVGIANAMLMSVTERFREIGTMKCLGALDSFIVKLFLLESSFQGAVGTIIGAVLGLLLTFLLALVSYGGYTLDYFPGIKLLIYAGLAFLIGSTLSLVGAILPAYRAAKMEPVDAMRTDV